MRAASRVLSLALAASVGLAGLVAAPAHAGVTPRIQGVVVDQGGREVDDVQVVALDADGRAVASALSYASDRPDGPQHGYFFLAVGRAGTYEVVLSKAGHRTANLGEHTVGRRGVVSLGEVTIERKPVASTTRLTLDDRRLSTSQRASATVRVATTATSRPTGRVSLRVDGREVRTTDLAAGDRGSVEVRLSRLERGRHEVKAVWTPASPYVRGSSSTSVEVVVRRLADRPAPRSWLPGSPLLRLQP